MRSCRLSRFTTRLGLRAFTLIEILIVVVILGILASIVLTSVWKASQEAAQTVATSELAKIRRHLEAYRIYARGQLPQVTAGDGTWGELIGPQFMTRPPSNTWVSGPNARLISFGTGPDTAFTDSYGWIYDPATGRAWAASMTDDGVPIPRP